MSQPKGLPPPSSLDVSRLSKLGGSALHEYASLRDSQASIWQAWAGGLTELLG